MTLAGSRRDKTADINRAAAADLVIDLVFIHCLMHGKKYSPEFLEKQAAKNESLAKWKYDQGKDDEAEKARKRAEKYKKEAEKLRKKAPR